MKKSRKTAIAGRLREMMLQDKVIINSEGNVFINGILKKRNVSKCILKKMGVKLNPHSMLYEIKGGSGGKETIPGHAERGRRSA